uniref:Uncharacterized protein n=1 Tax=Sipha flava TaxID=143950 RepID=A0A2S2QWM3_9HEMI
MHAVIAVGNTLWVRVNQHWSDMHRKDGMQCRVSIHDPVKCNFYYNHLFEPFILFAASFNFYLSSLSFYSLSFDPSHSRNLIEPDVFAVVTYHSRFLGNRIKKSTNSSVRVS